MVLLRRNYFLFMFIVNIWFWMPFSLPSLQIQAQSEPKMFSNRFLFRWAQHNKEYGSLCSVVDPSQYLHVLDKDVVLMPKPYCGFRVQFLDSNNRKPKRSVRRIMEKGEGTKDTQGMQCGGRPCSAGATGKGRKTSEKKKCMLWSQSNSRVFCVL